MKTNDIEQLIERYFDGETTIAEEKKLHKFFAQKEVPEQFRAEKAMFNHFARQKAARQPKRAKLIPMLMRWSAVAAVIMGVAWFMLKPTNEVILIGGAGYVIVNGKIITDPNTVQEHALKALDDVSCSPKKKRSNVRSAEAEQLMKEQLRMFGK